jgi:flagellin
MQVYNNASAFQVWKSYANNVSQLRNSMSRLSSGLKIQTAVDDPAGLAISERMRAQIRNSAQASINIENAISYMQTSDSWLQKIHDILGRMSELAVASVDGTKSQTDLDNLQAEFEQLQSELRRIVEGKPEELTDGYIHPISLEEGPHPNPAAKYGGQHLFSTGRLMVQIGPDYCQTFTGAVIDLRLNGGSEAWATAIDQAVTRISTLTAGKIAMDSISKAIDYISTQRATLGAQQSRLNHTLEGLRNYEDNIRASESRIRDVDVARETTEFSKYQILVQVGTAMLAQANAMPQGVVQLLG